MATSKFNKVVKKKNITYTHLNMRNATNGFKTRKNVYRYAKKSLVGGSASASFVGDYYSTFIDNVKMLIPASDAQKKVDIKEFNAPITIDKKDFPSNIILYAFIIFYCLKVHNFKINTTSNEGEKNKQLLTGLVERLIGVLNTLLTHNHQLKLINSNDAEFYVKNSDELFKILDIILHNGDITTQPKALATVKVKDYFTIDAQNKSIALVFSKSIIKSITINVVLETNVLNTKTASLLALSSINKGDTEFTSDRSTQIMTTPPGIDILPSNSINNSTIYKFDKILTHIKTELETIGITIKSDNTECNTIEILTNEHETQLIAFIKSIIDKFVSNYTHTNNWSKIYMRYHNNNKPIVKINNETKDDTFVEYIYNEMVQTTHGISNSKMTGWHKLFADILKTYNNIKSDKKIIIKNNDPITYIDTDVGHEHTYSKNMNINNVLYSYLSKNNKQLTLDSLMPILTDYIFTVLFVLMYYCIILLFNKQDKESLV